MLGLDRYFCGCFFGANVGGSEGSKSCDLAGWLVLVGAKGLTTDLNVVVDIVFTK